MKSRTPISIPTFSLLLIAALSILPSTAEAQRLRPGRLTDKVECKGDPSQSYAVYLPAEYTKKRSWPVLFGFSPGGAGRPLTEKHRAAAERFGWIVVGSNNSRNGPFDVAQRAAKAMWEDVRSRFNVDDKRLYACGLSGGAVVANWFATSREIPIAGVFMHARGDISGVPSDKSKTFFMLLPGIVSDFNFGESVRFLCLARRTGSRIHLDPQEGGHSWASPESCMGMLRYAELLARLDGQTAPHRALAKLIDEEAAALTSRLDGPAFLGAWERLEELDQLVHKRHKFKARFRRLAKKYKARLPAERAAWELLDKDCLFDAGVNDRYPSITSMAAANAARRQLYASHPGTTAAHFALVSQVLAPISLQRVMAKPPPKDIQDAYYAYAVRVKAVKTDFIAEAKQLVKRQQPGRAIVSLFGGFIIGTIDDRSIKKGVLRKLSRQAGYRRLLELVSDR